MTELREEKCPDCRETVERDWIVRSIPAGVEVPHGFRVEGRSGSHRTIAAPTRWVSVCACNL